LNGRFFNRLLCGPVLVLFLCACAACLSFPDKVWAGEPSFLFNGRPWLAGRKVLLEEGRVLVAAGDLAGALGGAAVYNPPFVEIRMPPGGEVGSVIFGPDSPVAVVKRSGGTSESVLDVPPRLWEGELYVPLRFTVTAAGGSVQWYDKIKAVSVHYGYLSESQLGRREAELGAMFYRRGLYRECLDHCRQAMAYGYETPEMYYLCVEAYRALGMPDMARSAGEDALKLCPVFADKFAFEKDFPILLEAYLMAVDFGQKLSPDLFREAAQKDLLMPLRVLLRLKEMGFVPRVMRDAVERYSELSPGSYLVELFRQTVPGT